MNFDDPDVLERMTGPDYKKYWKTTYGFDYVTKLEGTRVVRDNKAKELDIDDLSPLGKHCLESEFR